MIKNIIDTHIHIWDLKRVRYEWLDNDTSILNRSYQLEELLPEMNNTPVVSGILVQAANNLKDTALMLEAARRHPEIAGIVAWAPLNNSQQMQDFLEEQLLKEPYFKGVRHLIHNEADPCWLLQPQVLESLEMLAAHNIPYDIVGINEEHLKTAIRVSEKIPSLRMVLDHLNQPPISTKEQFGTWGDLMKEIATNSNVYAKISGLGTASGNLRGWIVDDIVPYVAYTLEQFGANRCFCGGDWPVSTLAGSYILHWERYSKMIAQLLDKDDAEKVYYKNASYCYSL